MTPSLEHGYMLLWVVDVFLWGRDGCVHCLYELIQMFPTCHRSRTLWCRQWRGTVQCEHRVQCEHWKMWAKQSKSVLSRYSKDHSSWWNWWVNDTINSAWRCIVVGWTKFEIGPCSIMGIWYLWIVFQISNIKKETSITEANCAILMVRIELVLFNTNNNYIYTHEWLHIWLSCIVYT